MGLRQELPVASNSLPCLQQFLGFSGKGELEVSRGDPAVEIELRFWRL